MALQQVCGSLGFMGDRREGIDRRSRELISEALQRRRERRADERRDSPRIEIAFDVREPGKNARSVAGDLSVEGASFNCAVPPQGDDIEMMFTVPNYVGPITARAVVVSRLVMARVTKIGVRFVELEVDAQLAIASWLENRSLPRRLAH